MKIIPFFLSASILTSFSTFLEHRFSMLTLLFKSRPSTFRKYTPKILMHLALLVLAVAIPVLLRIVIRAGTNTHSERKLKYKNWKRKIEIQKFAYFQTLKYKNWKKKIKITEKERKNCKNKLQKKREKIVSMSLPFNLSLFSPLR